MPQKKGFTLAELLIALAILGVIATFTIPKILTAQSNQQFNAIAKESASTISQAYQAYMMNNQPVSGTEFGDITPYINYVSVKTTSESIDALPGNVSASCDSGTICLKMHNGSFLYFYPGNTFGGTTVNNCVLALLDPDGKYSGGDTLTPAKTVAFMLYFNGAITTYGQARPNSVTSGIGWLAGPFGANPSKNPDWFSWN